MTIQKGSDFFGTIVAAAPSLPVSRMFGAAFQKEFTMNVKKTLLSAVAATSISVFTVGASAQAPDAMQQQAAPVSEQEIEKFAKAEQKVAKISEEWAPRVQSAGSTEEAEQIAEEAHGEMVEAIEDEGLTVQRYNEIFAQAQADAELAERIRSAA